MRRARIIFLTALLMSCKPIDVVSTDPEDLVPKVYSYEGQCLPIEFFGDSDSGCIRSVELVRFADGNFFYSIAMGAGQQWETSGYLLGKNNEWVRTVYFYSGITPHKYVFSGDLKSDPPSLEVVFDRNGNLSDLPPKTIELTEGE